MQQIETKNSHDYSQSIIKQVIYFAQILVNTRYIKCDECSIRKKHTKIGIWITGNGNISRSFEYVCTPHGQRDQ